MIKIIAVLFSSLFFLTFPDQVFAGISSLDNRVTGFSSIGGLITTALPLIFGFAALLAVVVFSIGALRYMASRGDAKAADGARSTMTGSVIGLVIVLGSAALSRQVLEPIFGFNLFGGNAAGNAGPSINLSCAVKLGSFCLGDKYPNFGALVTDILALLVSVGALVFFLILLYGGIRYMTARGDEKAVSEARATLANGFIGFLLMIGAIAIIELIARLLFNSSALII